MELGPVLKGVVASQQSRQRTRKILPNHSSLAGRHRRHGTRRVGRPRRWIQLPLGRVPRGLGRITNMSGPRGRTKFKEVWLKVRINYVMPDRC